MMTYALPRLLPPGARCTAYWYASRRALPAVFPYLVELGLRAARDARWYGIAAARVPEGPFPAVHQWPEPVWDGAAASMEPYRTAWEYAGRGGMLCYGGDADDIEFARAMAGYAGQLAGRLRVPLRLAAEGPPELSHAWPDWIWAVVAGAMARGAAADGDWHLRDDDLDAIISGYHPPVPRGDPSHPHGYWEAGDYDDVQEAGARPWEAIRW